MNTTFMEKCHVTLAVKLRTSRSTINHSLLPENHHGHPNQHLFEYHMRTFTPKLLGFLLLLSMVLPGQLTLAAPAAPKRPQEPTKPYPYQTEEVAIENMKAGCRLAGTLSLPRGAGPFPAVLLITGSGPQNRDEEILGHRPFLVLSDHLVRHGIAVLRMDDRGVGQSTGDYHSALNEDFAADVICATDYLRGRKEVDSQRIGLLGHSAGGVIAPLAAQRTAVNFMILLASPPSREWISSLTATGFFWSLVRSAFRPRGKPPRNSGGPKSMTS